MKVRGMDGLMGAVSVRKANEAMDNVSDELEDMARDVATNTSNRAPVLTGELRNYSKLGVVQEDLHTFTLMPEIYDNLPYFWRQNFEHKTKGLFFTTSFNEMEAVFGKRLQKAVDRTW